MLSISRRSIFDRCLRSVQRALPADCTLCGVASGPQRLCNDCDAALPRLSPIGCRICALPLTAGDLCGHCLSAPPTYDGVRAAFVYAFPLDALIQKYKYGGDLTLAPLLGQLLGRAPCAAVDAVIPMPLASGRLRDAASTRRRKSRAWLLVCGGFPCCLAPAVKSTKRRRRRRCRGPSGRATCAGRLCATSISPAAASPSWTT